MQTFLPYADFLKSAQCLDYRRLGKQRVEAMQLLKALKGETKGWRNHPACVMWEGYENALIVYMNTCIQEWVKRGYKNSIPIISVDWHVLPWWFGDDKFHLSHQSNLVRKNQEYYGPLFPNVPPNLEYVWPRRSLKNE